MTLDINNQLADKTFYASPTHKIHSTECHHCRPNQSGWRKLNSFVEALDGFYHFCRLCCPSESEIASLRQTIDSVSESSTENFQSSATKGELVSQTQKNQPELSNVTTNQVFSNKDKQPVNQTESEKTESKTTSGISVANSERQDNIADKSKIISNSEARQKSNQDKNKLEEERQPKKRYKILAGNGCHQAIAEVKGILVPPAEESGKFMLILSDGIELEVIFRNSRLKWIAYNRSDWVLGAHWFRGYPKMRDDRLVGFQIIAWDGNMPTNKNGEELWQFTGLWTLQKNLTVQRSMMEEDIRKIAKETGFIKKFKYTFTNSFDWVKSKKLWIGYVYKLICRRDGERLQIQRVIPFACPRIKPVPKNRKPNQGKGSFKHYKS